MDLAVGLGGHGALRAARLRDISLSGGYVEGVPTLPLWTSVWLELQRTYSSPATPNRVKGYVVRNEPGGLALEWCEFAPPVVRDLVAAHAIAAVEQRGGERTSIPGGANASKFLSRHMRDPLPRSDFPPRSATQRSDSAVP